MVRSPAYWLLGLVLGRLGEQLLGQGTLALASTFPLGPSFPFA
jgi:hypothetical protein